MSNFELFSRDPGTGTSAAVAEGARSDRARSRALLAHLQGRNGYCYLNAFRALYEIHYDVSMAIEIAHFR